MSWQALPHVWWLETVTTESSRELNVAASVAGEGGRQQNTSRVSAAVHFRKRTWWGQRQSSVSVGGKVVTTSINNTVVAVDIAGDGIGGHGVKQPRWSPR